MKELKVPLNITKDWRDDVEKLGIQIRGLEKTELGNYLKEQKL